MSAYIQDYSTPQPARSTRSTSTGASDSDFDDDLGVSNSDRIAALSSGAGQDDDLSFGDSNSDRLAAISGAGEGEDSAAAAAPTDNIDTYLAMPANSRGGFTARAMKAAGMAGTPASVLSSGDFEKTITRASAAAVCARVLGLGTALQGNPGLFTDVPLDHWAAASIYRCKEEGIFVGSDGAFSPGDDLSAGGAATLIARVGDPSSRVKFDRSASVKESNSKRDMPDASDLTVGDTAGNKRTFTDDVYKKHKGMVGDADVDLSYASHKWEADTFAKNWDKNRSRYEAVAAQTGVPARLIAALHWREASGNFNTYLHQGDPLGKKAVHWPTNIPIFYKWEDAAVHALNMKKSTKNDLGMTEDTTDLAAMATYAEYYNGLGYHNKGKPSPYVYSGTDQYSKGKYVADGVYDPNTKDKQVGIIALVKHISEGESGTGTLLEGQVVREGKAASEVSLTVTDAKGKKSTVKTNGNGFFSLEGTLNVGQATLSTGSATGRVTVSTSKPAWISLDAGISKPQGESEVKKEDTNKSGSDKSSGDSKTTDEASSIGTPSLKRGSKGAAVTAMQKRLIAWGARITADGDFGPATEKAVKEFQASHGLTADGVVGPKTGAALSAATSAEKAAQEKAKSDTANSDWLGGKTLKKGDKGDLVKTLQKKLNAYGAGLSVDGDFGAATERAVKAFQSANGLSADGVVGAKTQASLDSGNAKTIGSAPSKDDGAGKDTTPSTGGSDKTTYDSVAEERGAAAAKSAELTYVDGKKTHGSGSWETYGSNKGPWVNKFKEANKAGGNDTSYAWCGMFVGYNYAKAGIRQEILKNLVFWSGYRLHEFLTAGKYVGGAGKAGSWWSSHKTKEIGSGTGASRKKTLDGFQPRAGDIVLFRSDYSHVGMVTGYDASTGKMEVMEGNRGDKVQATAYGVGDGQITFIGRLNDADFEPGGQVDSSVAKAADPKVKHNDATYGSTS